jgi:hypothetical protein
MKMHKHTEVLLETNILQIKNGIKHIPYPVLMHDSIKEI